jgi:hypothetical protein
MPAWILIPVFVAGMLTGGSLLLMWANHPCTIPEQINNEQPTAEEAQL